MPQLYSLLLNSTWEPMKAITWQRAVTLLFNEKVEVLVNYEEDISSACGRKFPRPAVVRLLSRSRWGYGVIKFSRQNLYLRDNHRCMYCGQEFHPRDLTFDHVIPRSRGGRTEWRNIVSACKPCNQAKQDMTPEESGMKLLRTPYVPRWLRSSIRRHPAEWSPYLCWSDS